MKTTTQEQAIAQIIQSGIDKLDGYDSYGCDLHNRLYNEDYFIIGTYSAKEFLNAYDVWEAIEKVMEYEKDNFGQVNTEIHDPEKLANMLAYVIGEEMLNEIEALRECWDRDMTEEDVTAVREALTEKLAEYQD